MRIDEYPHKEIDVEDCDEDERRVILRLMDSEWLMRFVSEDYSWISTEDEMAAFLKAFNLDKSVLIVMDNNDEAVLRASANISKISTIPVEQINTYDLVKNAKVVISKKAVEKIQEVYGE